MKVLVISLLCLNFVPFLSAQDEATEKEFKSYSKFDFVPGNELIFFDDYATGSVGDFPASWNTNGSGELVTISNFEGKWLNLTSEVRYKPDLNIQAFPDNYTIEFDLIYTAEDTDGSNNLIDIDIFSSSSPYEFTSDGTSGARISVQGAGILCYNWKDGSAAGLETLIDKQVYRDKTKKVIHFSLWIQKQRGRLYADENKVMDIPMLLPAGVVCNAVSVMPGLYGEGERNMFISNVRIAVGAPDMRSKLMTEGKLVTRGILFDVNSDKIKAESYGTLKEISKVLAENPDVRVKIVGHTDSNGSDVTNLDLSKRRALSVKNSLSKDFGIDASRMDTDGKGESEPSAPNSTQQGMANNRRVEFIKL